MAKEFAKPFYASKKWKKCRKSYIAKRKSIDGGMCERCGEELGYILHHKIGLNKQNIDNPDISLSHTNLIYLCKRCHEITHGYIKEDIEGMVKYEFDDDGNVVVR